MEMQYVDQKGRVETASETASNRWDQDDHGSEINRQKK
jgi:hypothetical protein